MNYIEILFAILILLASAIFTKRDLLYGFLFLIFLTPLAHKEDFSLIIWDLLPVRIAFIGFVIGGLLKYKHYFTNKDKFKKLLALFKKYYLRDYIFIFLVLLLIQRGLSLLSVADFNFSVKLYLFYISIVVLYFFIKILFVKNKEVFINYVLKSFIYMSIATSVFAFAQLLLRIFFRKSIGSVWVIPNYTPRLGSTFWDVNHFGGFLVIAIPIAFSFVLTVKNNLYRLLYLLLTVVLCVFLLLTQSRSAWLGLAVGVAVELVVIYLLNFKKIVISILGTGVALLIAVVLFFEISGYGVVQRVASFMHHRLDSTDTHVYLLEGSAEVFFNNLIFGSGYGDFDSAFRETQVSEDYFNREPKLKSVKVPPHSVWGELLAENGGLGTIIYVLMMVLTIMSLITAIFDDKETRYKFLGLGILTSIVGILTTGIFYSYNLEFFWIIIFLGVAFTQVRLKYNYKIKYLINWWYKNPISAYLIVLPISIFSIFVNLGRASLVDWDEAIYAKVAKNILMTSDWLSLRWDNLAEYWFEKPPLYMWLTAVSFYVTGFNTIGARFVSAVFGVLCVVYTYKLASKLYNKYVGIISALILLSTTHFLYYARSAMLDVTVAFFILSTLYYLICYLNDPRKNSKSFNLIIAGILMGLGVMTKAIVGLLPIPIILAYIIVLKLKYKKQKILNLSDFLIFGGVSILVFGPWHLYSILAHDGQFIQTYLFTHIISRGTEGYGHEQPFYWFLEVIKVSFRIWLIPLILGVISLFKYDRNLKSYLFLIITSIVILGFFSLSKDKLQWYIIPIYPFLAIVAARFIERLISQVNSMLKGPYQFDYGILRFSSILCIFLFTIFYIIYNRDKVYFPDTTKDRVALVKINNTLFPLKTNPTRKLYYNKISTPMVLFYSDLEVEEVDADKIIELIENAGPSDTFSFLTPDDIYYNVNSTKGTEERPIVLSVKGSAGEWVLYTSDSRVELLRQELIALNTQINLLLPKYLQDALSVNEKITFNNLVDRRDVVINKLTEYGFPPEK